MGLNAADELGRHSQSAVKEGENDPTKIMMCDLSENTVNPLLKQIRTKVKRQSFLSGKNLIYSIFDCLTHYFLHPVHWSIYPSELSVILASDQSIRNLLPLDTKLCPQL